MLRLEAWRVRALLVGAAVAIAAAVAGAIPFAHSWEEGVDLQILFRLRGERPAPPGIVLVPIDTRAARSLFMPAAAEDFERCRDVRVHQPLPGYRNPDPPEILTRWPRCLHARVLEALALARPEVVIVDISFRPRSDPSGAYAEQDRMLAEAMRGLGRVVLVRKIKSDENAERAEPIVGSIESAALAVAPFLLVGEQLQRADKFCTFKEDDGWSGPCLPAVAHQITALEAYPELHRMLGAATTKDIDLVPARGEALLAHGALQAPVRLIRHLAVSDPNTAKRMRALLAEGASPAPRVRGLTEIYLGPGLRYFNFYGPPGRAFETLRYETLAAAPEAARPAPGSLRGKVVFIGFAEYENPEPIEHFTTPFTTPKSVKLSGVELAATAYANLLDGSAVQPAAGWLRALIMLALALCCTLLWVSFAPWVAFTLCLGVGLAYFGLAYGMFAAHALWLPIALPLGFVAPAAMGAGFASWHLEIKRQRDRSIEVMRAMLPARVVDHILPNNRKLTELRESVYGACVFTDAKGFTTLSEYMPHERMAQLMQEYFQTLFRVVSESGGEASDTAGDAMLTIWAAPAPDPMLRRRACAAALKIGEEIDAFNRARPPHEALPTRIGVDYGFMSRGLRGAPFHIEYRHQGDTINTAGRLQKLNSRLRTRVLASGEAIQGLEDGFLARDIGSFILPGKTLSTHTFELLAERARAKPEQLELCAEFALALAAYQAADPQAAARKLEARRRFAELHAKYASDGPCEFYAELCAREQFYGRQAIPIP